MSMEAGITRLFTHHCTDRSGPAMEKGPCGAAAWKNKSPWPSGSVTASFLSLWSLHPLQQLLLLQNIDALCRTSVCSVAPKEGPSLLWGIVETQVLWLRVIGKRWESRPSPSPTETPEDRGCPTAAHLSKLPSQCPQSSDLPWSQVSSPQPATCLHPTKVHTRLSFLVFLPNFYNRPALIS